MALRRDASTSCALRRTPIAGFSTTHSVRSPVSAEELKEKNTDGSDSLFWKILTESKLLKQIYCWLDVIISDRHEEYKKRLLCFWQWTYDNKEFFKTNCGDGVYKYFLHNIIELICLFDNLDKKNLQLILLSMSHIDLGDSSTWIDNFLDNLLRLANNPQNLNYIAKILIKFPEKNYYLYGDNEMRFQNLVRKLFDNTDTNQDAKVIYENYAKREKTFLRKIYLEKA